MTISMKESRPYAKMASTCLTRSPAQKRIEWVRPVTEPFAGGRYQVRILRKDLIQSAAELWRAAYPEVWGSPHEFLLDPEAYEKLMALDENWAEDSKTKVYCMSVVEELAAGKVVAATLLTKFERNLQVEFSFAATHPGYRKHDLTRELRRFTRHNAIHCGAEYFTTFCETWHDITQNWCIHGGWSIAGIFPGNFVRWNGEGEEYRGCTVHFYRIQAKAEEVTTKPGEWHLAPEVREVWEVLDKVNRRIAETFRASGKTEGV